MKHLFSYIKMTDLDILMKNLKVLHFIHQVGGSGKNEHQTTTWRPFETHTKIFMRNLSRENGWIDQCIISPVQLTVKS